MREFNYTGTCIAEKHYMVDVGKKINAISKLIEDGKYFTINRPRQYGKTTTINLLKIKHINDYIIIKTSFQGKGIEMFKEESLFCSAIVSLFLDGMVSNDNNFKQHLSSNVRPYKDFNELSKLITKLIKSTTKKILLFIDEVDESTNYELFSKFLGMLRDKYLKRNEGEDSTFHSVVFAGVHDIKNLKMKIRGDGEISYNSPWNIAVDFEVRMSFSAEEISTMLVDYENDHHTGMDIGNLSNKLFEYTSGYPYLVSKLCYIMDVKLNKNFTEAELEDAMKILLKENNTLFDDLIKNINRYKELYDLVERIVLEGEEINYNTQSQHLGIMYGIFAESNGKLKVHNKIFEILLYNYLIARREIEKGSALNYKYKEKFVNDDGNLNMELLLEKFQDMMKVEYRHIDEKFVEREGRLLFLAFLTPIINGIGFYFVETETRHSNRMDVVVTYNRVKFVIELKIWRGGKYEQEGREQLCEYLDSQNLNRGYMVFFNFNKRKKYIRDRLNVLGKEIYEVVV